MGPCEVASSVFFISDEPPLVCHASKRSPAFNINNNLAMRAPSSPVLLECVCFLLTEGPLCASLLSQAVLLYAGFISVPLLPLQKRLSTKWKFLTCPTPPLAPCPPPSYSDRREERDMLIKRNEIDICINRSENTKGVRSFQVSHFAAERTQKKFISPSQWLLEPPSSPPRCPSIGRCCM